MEGVTFVGTEEIRVTRWEWIPIAGGAVRVPQPPVIRLRVPGGWIYMVEGRLEFVPYSAATNDPLCAGHP